MGIRKDLSGSSSLPSLGGLHEGSPIFLAPGTGFVRGRQFLQFFHGLGEGCSEALEAHEECST